MNVVEQSRNQWREGAREINIAENHLQHPSVSPASVHLYLGSITDVWKTYQVLTNTLQM